LGAVGDFRAVLVLPLVLLTGFCFASMALVVTAVSRSYDFFLYYTTLVMTPMLLIGGVFFPLERMPEAIQMGAQALPLTHAVSLIRPLVIGGAPEHALLNLTVVGLYTLLALVLAVHLIQRRLGA
jgi:lipooligosaccharide transport system permease protein